MDTKAACLGFQRRDGAKNHQRSDCYRAQTTPGFRRLVKNLSVTGRAVWLVEARLVSRPADGGDPTKRAAKHSAHGFC